jgi:NAD(P)H-nitrite reductase large subunit
MRALVIGSGIAGITFAEEFKKLNPEAAATVLTHEAHGYYSRPMLSHGFSREDVETKIILKSYADLRAAGIEIVAPAEALAIDRTAKTVRYRSEGQESALPYDKLILAPGSDAVVPPPFRAEPELFRVVNSLDDLIALRRCRAEILAQGETPRWAVVGGGLIGCEAGSDLAKAGDQVVLFHALPRLMERQLEEEDSASLLKLLRGQGLDVRLNAAVQGFVAEGARRAVRLEGGTEGGFHEVIVACGFKPRVELARAAGLDVNRGIAVDWFLRGRDWDIHVLGDAAECADGRLYAYIMPIRHQALWLAQYLAGKAADPWQPPSFKLRAKVHGFVAAHPCLF